MTVGEVPLEVPPPWREPWRTGGLSSMLQHPRILWLFTQNELKDKYRGTWLGSLWAYAFPIMRFVVYFFVVGVLFGLHRKVVNFPVYIFCGVVTIQYFTTSLNTGTRSLSRNSSMLRRVNVPTESIPMAAVLASLIRLRPAATILLVAAVATGWRPLDVVYLPYAVAGMALLTVFVVGLVLISSVANMYVRDTQFAVEAVIMLAYWASPVIYPWTMVQQRFGDGWLTTAYLSNPVTVGMTGIRSAFWQPTTDPALLQASTPTLPLLPVVIAVAISVAALVLGLALVRRTEHRVASRVQWSS